MIALFYEDNQSVEIMDVIRMLVTAGADVRLKNADGDTPSGIAQEAGIDRMEYLFKRLEKTSPWSENFKRLRHEALLLALHPVRGKDALISELPSDLFAQFLAQLAIDNNLD